MGGIASDENPRIGERFGIPWETLAEINQMSYPYQVNPGTNLMIPLPLQ